MPLTAGSLTNDLSARALVVGVLDGRALETSALCRQAERFVAEGADILELTGGTVDHIKAVRTVVAVPLAVAVAGLFLLRPGRVEIIDSHLRSIEEDVRAGRANGDGGASGWSLPAFATTLATQPLARRLLVNVTRARTRKVWSSGVEVVKTKLRH